jgi:hypothetical protein
MNNRPRCAGHEQIVRAIRSADYDEKKRRLSSGLFKGKEISVSRLSILPLNKLFLLFHSELDRQEKNPPTKVKWAGEMTVSTLESIGRNYEPAPTGLTVEADPTERNPAHAVIPQRITTGLAHRINRALTIHSDSSVSHPDPPPLIS